MPESAYVAITTVNSILILTCIVGNSLVCAVVQRNRDMRVPINYLLVNLAVADFIYAIFLIPETVFKHISAHPGTIAGNVLCAVETLPWIGAISSALTLLAIAFERYYSVIHPLSNKGKLTRKPKVIIPVAWIFALIINIPSFLQMDLVEDGDRRYCASEWLGKSMEKAYTSSFQTIILLSITMMVVLYSRIVYRLWFKSNNELTHQQQGVLRVRKRVTSMAVTVSAIFGVCWGTDMMLHILIDVGSYKFGPFAIPIAHTMIMFNSAVNPFAYALINQRFREKMKGMICCGSYSSAPRSQAQDSIEMVKPNKRETLNSRK